MLKAVCKSKNYFEVEFLGLYSSTPNHEAIQPRNKLQINSIAIIFPDEKSSNTICDPQSIWKTFTLRAQMSSFKADLVFVKLVNFSVPGRTEA